MKNLAHLALGILSALLLTGQSTYAAIVAAPSQETAATVSTISNTQVQSFTALFDNIVGAGISIAANPPGAPRGDITLAIYDALSGGNLVASETALSVFNAGPGFAPVDVFFSTPAAVNPGQTYFLRVSVAFPGFLGSYGWGVNNSNPYPGGQFYLSATSPLSSTDAAFRIYADDGAVGGIPEPGTLVLVIAGLALTGWRAQRRRS